MPITVQYDVPAAQMVPAALQAGAAQGEAQYAQRRDRRWEVSLQAAQEQARLQQRGYALEQQRQMDTGRMMQAAYQFQQQQERAAEEFQMQHQLRQDQLDQEGLRNGTLHYTETQQKQIRGLDDGRAQVLNDPQYGPPGSTGPDRERALALIDNQRRNIRPVQVMESDKPPTIKGPDGEGQYGTGDWFVDPEMGIFTVDQDANGQKWRMHVDPSKMPAALNAERLAKEKKDEETATGKAEVLQFEKELLPQWQDRKDEIDIQRADVKTEDDDALDEWKTGRDAAAEKALAMAEQKYKRAEKLKPAKLQGETPSAFPVERKYQIKEEIEQAFEASKPVRRNATAMYPYPRRPTHPSLEAEGEQAPGAVPEQPVGHVGRPLTADEEAAMEEWFASVPSGTPFIDPETGQQKVKS